jgi:hypothetical protein
MSDLLSFVMMCPVAEGLGFAARSSTGEPHPRLPGGSAGENGRGCWPF